MSVTKIQAEFLKPGDEVAIISPSYSIDEKIVADAVTVLEDWGLRVRIGKNTFKTKGPFAGSESERLFDLQEMTDDQQIKAVFCSRGGYGVSKIINKVDFAALKKVPKWYIGFSDITVLHMWLNEKCGLISIHGEMPLNYNNPKKSRETLSSLKEALFGDYKPLSWKGTFYRPAATRGEITGGNLSIICSLTGSPAEPSTRGKILFIEDVGEYYYHLDRMLTSLKLAGKLEGLSALIVGGMNKMEDGKTKWGMSVEETIYNIVSDYDYPVLFGFPAGHVTNNRSFYIGKNASIRLDDDEATLTFV